MERLDHECRVHGMRRQAIRELGRGGGQDLYVRGAVSLASLPEHALHIGHRLHRDHALRAGRDEAREVSAARTELERAAVTATGPCLLHELLRRVLVVVGLRVPVSRIVRGRART